MAPSAPPKSLKARAVALLARREHSRAELERKLSADASADEAHPRQLAEVLDDLAARGLLDDRRAAEAVLAGRSQRFGGRRLRQELQSRGLDPELVAPSLQVLADDEFARARTIWQRRFGTAAPAGLEGARERARQARFLIGRGFSPEVVRRVVQGLDDDA